MAKFVKGKSGNPAGKPKGAKDKRWADLTYWFGLVSNNIDQLKPRERAEIGLRGLELLISRLKSLPASPEESVNNADDAIKLVEALENEPHR